MERTISLPDELLAQIEGTAAQQGKSVDEWIEESLRAHIEERPWRDLLEYGRETGQASGYSETDVPGIVRKRRRIVAGRA
jgi:metal-responsive CopG/Arc/MetJ family transcriptional regulator